MVIVVIVRKQYDTVEDLQLDRVLHNHAIQGCFLRFYLTARRFLIVHALTHRMHFKSSLVWHEFKLYN